MRVDWLDEPVVQSVWRFLGSWVGACQLWEGRFRSPLAMLLSVRGVSRVLYSILADAFRAVARPYLAHVRREDADRVLLCEFAALRLARDAVACARALGGDATITGGYAAWQLEHAERARAGHDAFPFVLRGPKRPPGIRRDNTWIPRDIDLVFCGDAAAILPRLQELYGVFCGTIACGAPPVNVFQEFRTRRAATPADEPLDFAAVMERLWFPPAVRRRAIESAASAPRAASRIRRSWRMLFSQEPLYPTAFHVHHVDVPLEEALDNFDLVHCRVRLESDGCAWRAEACEETRRCVRERELRVLAAPACSVQAITAAMRVRRYYECGYAFREEK